MNPQTRSAVLVRHYESKELYDQLARELRRLLDNDPRFPRAFVQVKDRFKGAERLIEKIQQNNAGLSSGVKPIAADDFQDRIDDILGLRMVCLRLSQLNTLSSYIEGLVADGILVHQRQPTRRATFRVPPYEEDPNQPPLDMQYSGYSSIHFVVSLGPKHDAFERLGALRTEIQLRTIFEEAWGEVDHKYRYEVIRSGRRVPDHVHDGFRDLGLYLQAVARHAEHLCEELDRISAAPERGAGEAEAVDLRTLIQRKLSGIPAERTVAYIENRLQEHSRRSREVWDSARLDAAVTNEVLERYARVFWEILDRNPFQNPREFDLDVVPLVNYVLFSSIQPSEVAEAGLRSALQHRPGVVETD
ncbi:MAG TPA: RelA/SpoT domain-containing protein [Pyrinomonadaceae bacterium]|nr:RelA/SpoT domain-containing protein [Pyrinomonadaceae bacterium]